MKIIEGFHYLVLEESKLFKLFIVWCWLCKGHPFFFFFFRGEVLLKIFTFAIPILEIIENFHYIRLYTFIFGAERVES